MEDLYNFETILSMLKTGHKAARKSWDEGLFIKIMHPDNKGVMTVPYIYIDFTGVPKEDEMVRKNVLPWTPSQVDILCEDWTLV